MNDITKKLASLVIGPVNFWDLVRCDGDEAKLRAVKNQNHVDWCKFAQLNRREKKRLASYRKIKDIPSLSDPYRHPRITETMKEADKFYIMEDRIMNELKKPELAELLQVVENFRCIGCSTHDVAWLVECCLQRGITSFAQMVQREHIFFITRELNFHNDYATLVNCRISSCLRTIYGFINFDILDSFEEMDIIRTKDLKLESFFDNDFFRLKCFKVLECHFEKIEKTDRYLMFLQKFGCKWFNNLN